jgi:hypothetical protein
MNKLSELKAVITSTWHSLSPAWQATVVVAVSAAGTFLGDQAGRYLLDPSSACWTWPCLRHLLVAAVGAGVVAGKAFYMRPGPGPKAAAPALPVADPAK